MGPHPIAISRDSSILAAGLNRTTSESSAGVRRSVNRQDSGEGEAVAHASGSCPRQHIVRMTNADLRHGHVAGEELSQGVHPRACSAIEGVAHGSRVWILAVS